MCDPTSALPRAGRGMARLARAQGRSGYLKTQPAQPIAISTSNHIHPGVVSNSVWIFEVIYWEFIFLEGKDGQHIIRVFNLKIPCCIMNIAGNTKGAEGSSMWWVVELDFILIIQLLYKLRLCGLDRCSTLMDALITGDSLLWKELNWLQS